MKKKGIDINNKKGVYNFLEKKLYQNSTFKGKYFYKTIINIYEKYPVFTKNLINNLPDLTNYKSYFYLLQYAKNDNLEISKHIYNILIRRYQEDIKLYRQKEYNKLSVLAKWLPRKNKKFDRSYNFVKKFNKLMYPNIDSQPAEKIYRKTVSDISKSIGIIEHDLCAKKLENIDYDKITFRNFIGNYNKLWEMPEKMEKYIAKRNNKLRFLIKRMLFIVNSKDKNKYNREIEILNKLWEEKYNPLIEKYTKKLPLDNVLVVDLSSRMYNEMKWQLMGIYLLSLYKNNYVLINKKTPLKLIKLNTIEENITQLIVNITTCDKFDLNKLDSMENKNKLIISDKNINSSKNNIILKLEDTKIKVSNNKYIGNPFYYRDNDRKEKIHKVLKYGEMKRNNKYIVILIILFLVTIFFIY